MNTDCMYSHVDLRKNKEYNSIIARLFMAKAVPCIMLDFHVASWVKNVSINNTNIFNPIVIHNNYG